MQDETSELELLYELLGRLEVEVRRESMGGAGGGVCTLRGRRVLFVDLDADAATCVEAALAALASDSRADTLFLPPALRERVDRLRAASDGSSV
ncbi:MAG: hypothetical protein HY763_13420 [Planctomycetes bacterium]|nr:hypothetical protein [Planctomycetota bacterium]